MVRASFCSTSSFIFIRPRNLNVVAEDNNLSFWLRLLAFKRLSLRNTLNEVDLDAKAKQCLQKKKLFLKSHRNMD